MEIIINDKWKLSTDLNNVILHQKISDGGEVISRGRYTGQLSNPVWRERYHSTFKSALLDLIELHVKKIEKVEAIVAEIESYKTLVRNLPIINRN